MDLTNPLYRPCLTRSALLRWSGFRLPAVARKPREVPALTLEQLRGFERRGCFDAFHFCGSLERPLLVWKPRKRKRGATALYSIYDVATARLIGWMLAWSVPHLVIATILRSSKSAGRALLDAQTAEYALVLQNSSGFIAGEQGLRDYRALYSKYAHLSPDRDIKQFPLEWLGMRGALPRIQKELGKAPTVPLWNRRVPLDVAISAQEARAQEISGGEMQGRGYV